MYAQGISMPSQRHTPDIIGHLKRTVDSSLAIFAVALAIRLVFVQRWTSGMLHRVYETNECARIAWALVSGFGYSSPWPNTPLAATAQQPPVYPLLLAAIFKVSGSYTSASAWIAMSINALASALTAVLIYRLGERYFGRMAARIAAWIWVLWIFEIAACLELWNQALAALAIAAFLLIAPALGESERLSHWTLAGAAVALAALLNPAVLAIFIPGLLWVFLWKPLSRGRLRCAVLCILAFILVLTPWTLRNYLRFQRVIPVRDNFGMELWIGNRPGMSGIADFSGDFPLRNPQEYSRLGEIAFMAEKQSVALAFIRQHPAQFVVRCVRRAWAFWIVPPGSVWFLISALAWAGAILCFWRNGRRYGMLFALSLVFFPVSYYLTHIWPTYRTPIEPVLLLLAANAACAFVSQLARLPVKRSQKPAPAVSAAP